MGSNTITDLLETGLFPHMPVITAPPVLEADIDERYQDAPDVSVEETNGELGPGLWIGLSGLDLDDEGATLFTMFAGYVHYVPQGAPLPRMKPETGEPADNDVPVTCADTDTICIQTFMTDFDMLSRRVPAGVPAPAWLVYRNVDEHTVRAQLAPRLAALPEEVLLEHWDWNNPLPEEEDDCRAELEGHYLDRGVLENGVPVFVLCAMPVGKAGPSLTDSEEREFTLQVIDGLGNVLSPVALLQWLPAYAGEWWEGHPLLTAIDQAGVLPSIALYVRFELWNAAESMSPGYNPLPPGTRVDLMSAAEGGEEPAEVVLELETNDEGIVGFIPERDDVKGKTIFFVVHTGEAEHAGHVLPATWSTRGWEPVTGASAADFTRYSGVSLGTQNAPVVFRIGLDFHLKLTAQDISAPKGMPVSVHAWHGNQNAIPDEAKTEGIRTTIKGELHGLLFDVEPGQHVAFRLKPEIEDTEINLPRAEVRKRWQVIDQADPPWEVTEFDVQKTSLGSPVEPERRQINERPEGVFFLKTLRDLSVFLYKMTGGDWEGIEDLQLFRRAWLPGLTSMAWPIARVHIEEGHHRSRETIVHEIGHQVMWQEIGYSGWQIAWLAPGNRLVLRHSINLLATPQHALIDGWPEFLGDLFNTSFSFPNWGYDVVKGNTYALPHNITSGGSNWDFHQLKVGGEEGQGDEEDLRIVRRVAPVNSQTDLMLGPGWTVNNQPRFNIKGATLHLEEDFSPQAYVIATVVNRDRLILRDPYRGSKNDAKHYFIHGPLRPMPRIRMQSPIHPIIDFDENGILDEAMRNRGESVEGNVTNSLFYIFKNQVVRGAGGPFVAMNRDGDITDLDENLWILDSDIQSRFQQLIWQPFKALSEIEPKKDVTSTAFFEAVKRANQAEWHRVLGELQRFNLAMEEPTIISVEPITLPDGFSGLTVHGTGFAESIPFLTDETKKAPGTRVTINQQKVDPIDVTIAGSEELTARLPAGAAEPWQVEVITRAGSAVYSGGDNE